MSIPSGFRCFDWLLIVASRRLRRIKSSILESTASTLPVLLWLGFEPRLPNARWKKAFLIAPSDMLEHSLSTDILSSHPSSGDFSSFLFSCGALASGSQAGKPNPPDLADFVACSDSSSDIFLLPHSEYQEDRALSSKACRIDHPRWCVDVWAKAPNNSRS